MCEEDIERNVMHMTGTQCRPGTHPVIEGSQQRARPCITGNSLRSLGGWRSAITITPALLLCILLLLLLLLLVQRAEVDQQAQRSAQVVGSAGAGGGRRQVQQVPGPMPNLSEVVANPHVTLGCIDSQTGDILGLLHFHMRNNPLSGPRMEEEGTKTPWLPIALGSATMTGKIALLDGETGQLGRCRGLCRAPIAGSRGHRQGNLCWIILPVSGRAGGGRPHLQRAHGVRVAGDARGDHHEHLAAHT